MEASAIFFTSSEYFIWISHAQTVYGIFSKYFIKIN